MKNAVLVVCALGYVAGFVTGGSLYFWPLGLFAVVWLSFHLGRKFRGPLHDPVELFASIVVGGFLMLLEFSFGFGMAFGGDFFTRWLAGIALTILGAYTAFYAYARVDLAFDGRKRPI